MTTLPQLQAAAMEGPTGIRNGHLPPEPWIELHPEAVARFRYPTRGLTHKCLGHPLRGPLYMALNALEALPLELDPALRAHLREHFGIDAAVHPTVPQQQPRMEPGVPQTNP